MRKIALFLFLLVSFLNLSAQQTRQITGMVTDGQLGDPLIGVSVAIKGSTLGAVTDVSGKYSIRIPANQQTVLVFRYIGYVSREVTVGTENTINIKLSQEDKSLNEVV
ncbi:SusC/RagA family TonB-linked outer membrane protein, partial [Pseudoxanthomonas sp. SGD-10]